MKKIKSLQRPTRLGHAFGDQYRKGPGGAAHSPPNPISTNYLVWVKPCGPAEQSVNDSASRPAHSMGCDSRKVSLRAFMAECQRRTYTAIGRCDGD
jgi:hypothetical protein